MNSNDNNYLLNYREEEVRYIMQRVQVGESCSLVGVSSTGKSNFFRFIFRDNVKSKYLGDNADKYLFVLLDSNSLSIAGMSEWKIYELMLHRLLIQAERLSVDDKIVEHFDDLYQRVVASHDALLGQRYIERFLAFLCDEASYRLVFLFDEFDEIIRNFDRRFFLNLRAIRDEFKGKVAYIVASRNELSLLREDISEVEAFYELLSINVCGLKPYNNADAKFMIQHLARRRSVSLDENETNLLLEATGGHPGILRAAIWSLDNGALDQGTSSVELWLNNAGVWDECLKIWDSLEKEEQTTLSTIILGNRQTQILPVTLDLLEMKGLIILDQDDPPVIFCKIFKQFINERLASPSRGITIDLAKAMVSIDGRIISELTKLELSVLSYLFEKRGDVCTRDELITYLYPGEQVAEFGISDNRLDTLIGRLREKIEPDRSKPRYVLTIRGFGFKLAE